jgi:type II secretory pathway pseudopilin PulG
MTLTEVVVSALILGISSQVSLQGWSRTSQAASTSARTDQQVRLLEQQLLATRRALARATVAADDCRWEPEAVVGVLEGLSKETDLEASWQFQPAGDGLWLVVELMGLSAPDAAIPFKRSQLMTPAGLGHCPQEANDDP